ncbi:MAG TPA: tetratricopeptide repeat protein [Bryobacteraceae bacterium]|nr:tetratricopeptide repeat protein [Bryobacteraceae bacterium]
MKRNATQGGWLRLAPLFVFVPVCWADVGSAACAPCHKAIYDRYQKTGMARSSGRTGTGEFRESFALGSFVDAKTGARYRVSDRYMVSFERGPVRGERAMEYFLGSGLVGRSYAGMVEGFLFQSPATYYSARGAWGLSPGYAVKGFVDVARPVEPECLRCHASRVQEGAPPFLEGGVSCERCHGPGEAHVAGRGKMVNPAKLEPERRDSVCLQCHLTGVERVDRVRGGALAYRPGDRLADFVSIFVRKGSERTATDHAEQLARSQCRQAAGAKLWCGTCHDAHGDKPGAAEQACAQCHERHKNGEGSCVGCHMPKGATREGEHVVYTDHTIRRRLAGAATAAGGLELFPGMTAGEREWALAEPVRRAHDLQRLAARPEADAAVLAQLAQIYDRSGRGREAAGLYERVLRLEPDHATAQANLGIYWLEAGQVREALALWDRAFARKPGMLSAGLNLAMAQMQLRDRAGAVRTLRRVLRFHPDSAQARELLGSLL